MVKIKEVKEKTERKKFARNVFVFCLFLFSDVVYDPGLFDPLAKTIKEFTTLGSQVILACTERNSGTLQEFLKKLGRYSCFAWYPFSLWYTHSIFSNFFFYF